MKQHVVRRCCSRLDVPSRWEEGRRTKRLTRISSFNISCFSCSWTTHLRLALLLLPTTRLLPGCHCHCSCRLHGGRIMNSLLLFSLSLTCSPSLRLTSCRLATAKNQSFRLFACPLHELRSSLDQTPRLPSVARVSSFLLPTTTTTASDECLHPVSHSTARSCLFVRRRMPCAPLGVARTATEMGMGWGARDRERENERARDSEKEA